MKTEIFEQKSELARAAAGRLCTQLGEKGDSVLALSCGETMKDLWNCLAECCAAGKLSLKDARILCVTEYCGVEPEKSCRHALMSGLLQNTDARPERCFFPDPDKPEAYDELIASCGGVDMAVLGIGEDCHIGYNEPGTLFDTGTHLQKLTERTKRQLLKRGFTEEDMPAFAVTMGIRDLTNAGAILLLAAGEDKSPAVYQMLYAKTTSYIPAAYLQIPSEVTVMLDREAAAKL